MRDHARRDFLVVGLGTLGSLGVKDGAPDRTPGGSTPRAGNETTDSKAPSDSPGEATHHSFNHAEPLHRVDAGFVQRDVANYYLAVVTNADHAAAFPTDRFENQEATAFVTDTDYSQATVVVLQDRRSSSHPNLELRRADTEGDTVTIEAEYPDGARTADITTDTLLVRVSTDESDVHAARATIRSQHGTPDQVGTRNVYGGVPTFDSPGDLLLRNRDCSNTPVSVTVTYEGDLFFRDGLDLSPASLRRVDGLVSYAGEWAVAVRTGGETVERSWSVTGETTGDVLVDVVDDGSVSLSHHATGIDATDPGVCETNDYPYESSDPSKNLDHPAELWVLDESDREHHLMVTIRDGDTEVFSGDFDTRAGYDKARRAGLLAKKTTYTVDVTMDEETTASRSVAVREGVKTLEVRITEARDLSVSVR